MNLCMYVCKETTKFPAHSMADNKDENVYFMKWDVIPVYSIDAWSWDFLFYVTGKQYLSREENMENMELLWICNTEEEGLKILQGKI